MRFVLRGAALPDRGGLFDILVDDGRIAAVGPRIEADAPAEACRGRLLTAGLVETHIHLDKAGIMGRCLVCEGTLAEAVAETARAKAGFTVEDVFARASTVVERAILGGTTLMRTFVEVDPRAGFRSLEAVKAVRERYRTAITIEICAFAQEGLTNDPETEAMLDEALRSGADLVGGCPYTDPAPAEHVRRIFALARRHDVAVDFHLDFDLDPAHTDLPAVMAATEANGWGGRVSVGHATNLSALPPAQFEAAGRRLANAGIALTVLPATDLYLNGRSYDHLVPRGVTPAHRLVGLGVDASIATNNVLNPFTPFGDASLIRMANLYATVAQAGTSDALGTVFGMVTDAAARVLGRPYGVVPGAAADLVLLEAASPAAAIAENVAAVAAWKAGRLVFRRPEVTISL